VARGRTGDRRLSARARQTIVACAGARPSRRRCAPTMRSRPPRCMMRRLHGFTARPQVRPRDRRPKRGSAAPKRCEGSALSLADPMRAEDLSCELGSEQVRCTASPEHAATSIDRRPWHAKHEAAVAQRFGACVSERSQRGGGQEVSRVSQDDQIETAPPAEAPLVRPASCVTSTCGNDRTRLGRASLGPQWPRRRP